MDSNANNCVVKPCARCGLNRSMRTRDTVCDGCSNKLHRLVCRKEEMITALATERDLLVETLRKIHRTVSRDDLKDLEFQQLALAFVRCKIEEVLPDCADKNQRNKWGVYGNENLPSENPC